jgi:hypothetical protein
MGLFKIETHKHFLYLWIFDTHNESLLYNATENYLYIIHPVMNGYFSKVKYFFLEDEFSLWINTIPIVLCGVHSMGNLNVSMKRQSFFD